VTYSTKQTLIVVLQVRVIALGCAADLLKESEAKKIAASNPEFIPTLLNALKVCTYYWGALRIRLKMLNTRKVLLQCRELCRQ